jgi:hypothetical protein
MALIERYQSNKSVTELHGLSVHLDTHFLTQVATTKVTRRIADMTFEGGRLLDHLAVNQDGSSLLK